MKRIYFLAKILIIYSFFISNGLADKSDYFDKGKMLFDKKEFNQSKIFLIPLETFISLF